MKCEDVWFVLARLFSLKVEGRWLGFRKVQSEQEKRTDKAYGTTYETMRFHSRNVLLFNVESESRCQTTVGLGLGLLHVAVPRHNLISAFWSMQLHFDVNGCKWLKWRQGLEFTNVAGTSMTSNKGITGITWVTLGMLRHCIAENSLSYFGYAYAVGPLGCCRVRRKEVGDI